MSHRERMDQAREDEQARRDSLLASIEAAWEMVARAEAIGSEYLARSHKARIVSMTKALQRMEEEGNQ